MTIKEALEHLDQEHAAEEAGARQLAHIIADALQHQPGIELAAVLAEHPSTVAVELFDGRQYFVSPEGA